MYGMEPDAPNQGADATSGPAGAPDPGAALDADVSCLRCGYNLRGLSGDLIRCPECFELTPISEAMRRQRAIDDERRARTRGRLGTGASLCAIAAGTAAAFGALFWVFADFFEPIRHVPLRTCAVIWLTGALLHWAICRRLPNWGRAFLRHQLYAVPAALGNVLLIQGAFACGVIFLAAIEPPTACIVFVLPVAVLGVLFLRPMRWFSTRASEALEPLVEAKLRESERT